MKRLLLALSLLAASAGAQEYIPPPIDSGIPLGTASREAPGLAQLGPPIVAPPPYQPFNFQLDQELAARGHRNKIAGAVLIALGSLAHVAGDALMIYAATHPQTPSTVGHDGYNYGMIAGGAVLSVAGLVTAVVGIPIYAVGGSQMKRAHFGLRASAMRLEF